LAGTVMLQEPRARVKLHPDKRKLVAALLRRIRRLTEPGEPIFVAPYAPVLYYLSGRPNPTGYDLLLPGQESAETHASIRDTLESSGVRLVLLDDSARDGREDRRFSRYAPTLSDYIERNFRLQQRVGTWALYLRSAAPSENRAADSP
jgi:hypothetical protein